MILKWLGQHQRCVVASISMLHFIRLEVRKRRWKWSKIEIWCQLEIGWQILLEFLEYCKGKMGWQIVLNFLEYYKVKALDLCRLQSRIQFPDGRNSCGKAFDNINDNTDQNPKVKVNQNNKAKWGRPSERRTEAARYNNSANSVALALQRLEKDRRQTARTWTASAFTKSVAEPHTKKNSGNRY